MNKADQHYCTRSLHMLFSYHFCEVGIDSPGQQTGNTSISLKIIDIQDAIFYFIYETSYLMYDVVSWKIIQSMAVPFQFHIIQYVSCFRVLYMNSTCLSLTWSWQWSFICLKKIFSEIEKFLLGIGGGRRESTRTDISREGR